MDLGRKAMMIISWWDNTNLINTNQMLVVFDSYEVAGWEFLKKSDAVSVALIGKSGLVNPPLIVGAPARTLHRTQMLVFLVQGFQIDCQRLKIFSKAGSIDKCLAHSRGDTLSHFLFARVNCIFFTYVGVDRTPCERRRTSTGGLAPRRSDPRSRTYWYYNSSSAYTANCPITSFITKIV